VSGVTEALAKRPLDVVPAALARAKADAEREEETVLREHPDLRGLYADRKAPLLFAARLRLGIRVERTSLVDDHRAWVELAGRNADGSIYRFSELYAKVGEKWLQRLPPLGEDIAALPVDFAPSLCTPVTYRATKLEKLLRDPGSLHAVHEGPTMLPAPVVKKPESGHGRPLRRKPRKNGRPHVCSASIGRGRKIENAEPGHMPWRRMVRRATLVAVLAFLASKSRPLPKAPRTDSARARGAPRPATHLVSSATVPGRPPAAAHEGGSIKSLMCFHAT
jgi:hypothetical protein